MDSAHRLTSMLIQVQRAKWLHGQATYSTWGDKPVDRQQIAPLTAQKHDTASPNNIRRPPQQPRAFLGQNLPQIASLCSSCR